MSGMPGYVAGFEQLRGPMLARLLEVRASLDPALARLRPDDARLLFDGVLQALRTLLVTGDQVLHRGFVQTFVALRGSDGVPPEHALRLLVEIGDVAIQVARRDRPDDTTLRLAIISGLRLTARLVNDLLADELAKRAAPRQGTMVGR